METILNNLLAIAARERAVARQKLTNDMTLLVYPVDGGVVVGLGYEGKHAHRAPSEDVVRKRSSDLARYGAWLPAMFVDGGVYVATRAMSQTDTDTFNISAIELSVAQELLS